MKKDVRKLFGTKKRSPSTKLAEKINKQARKAEQELINVARRVA
jgi:hypothetical protein